MREDQMCVAILSLLNEGAVLEEFSGEGRRFVLRQGGERVAVPGGVARKLVEEQRVKASCRLGRRVLWHAA
jgi:hypothetical protein